ncbi:MAG TPA: alanine racemase [Gemmatimonadaceae bacterium]|nr:alanine racemase [Gemmatimonadaceae bacterium]
MTRQHAEVPARAWIEVDLGALRRNGAAMARHAGVPILPMIKADGYGLGAVAAARALESLDPWGYGVATTGEGADLRAVGIRRPIVAFSPLWGDDLDACRRHGLTPALGDRAAIERWTAGGGAWHLAIDTGMSRAGAQWDDLDPLRDLIAASPPDGAFTHFHSAERNDGSRERQEERFAAAVERLPARPRLLHTENSAACERTNGSRWDLVRPGIFLYGVGSGPGSRLSPEPVVGVRARITELRQVHAGETVSYSASYRAVGERRIATLPLGHADGYRRAFGNRATVIVGGRRALVAGVVTMDMTMIDVTGIDCEVGSVVTLVGADSGEHITVADLALAGDLSPYELLTGLRLRMERLYLDDTA